MIRHVTDSDNNADTETRVTGIVTSDQAATPRRKWVSDKVQYGYTEYSCTDFRHLELPLRPITKGTNFVTVARRKAKGRLEFHKEYMYEAQRLTAARSAHSNNGDGAGTRGMKKITEDERP